MYTNGRDEGTAQRIFFFPQSASTFDLWSPGKRFRELCTLEKEGKRKRETERKGKKEKQNHRERNRVGKGGRGTHREDRAREKKRGPKTQGK